MNAPMRSLAQIVAKYRPLEKEYDLGLKGCWPWPVVIEYDYTPGTRQTWDTPETVANAQILAIRDRASGKDIRGVLPDEFVKALESDLAGGGL